MVPASDPIELSTVAVSSAASLSTAAPTSHSLNPEQESLLHYDAHLVPPESMHTQQPDRQLAFDKAFTAGGGDQAWDFNFLLPEYKYTHIPEEVEIAARRAHYLVEEYRARRLDLCSSEASVPSPMTATSSSGPVTPRNPLPLDGSTGRPSGSYGMRGSSGNGNGVQAEISDNELQGSHKTVSSFQLERRPC